MIGSGGHPVFRDGRESHKRRGALDHPLEPVIGRRPCADPLAVDDVKNGGDAGA